MQQKKLYALILMLISSYSIFAQPDPVEGIIEANHVKGVVQSNGALFWDFSEGQFVTDSVPGALDLSTLRSSGLWMGGLTSNSLLKGSVQLYNENEKTDFIPGTISDSAPFDLNGIWSVTSDDIEAHLADLNDNGVVDNPLPSIFGYPGTGNAFFSDFNNGASLPQYNPQGQAPFFDSNGNAIYEPDLGDIPRLAIRFCETTEIPAHPPTQMLWWSFHDQIPHSESQMQPMNIIVQTTVFAYGCEEDTPFNNTIFVRFKIIYLGDETLHSTHFGLFNDFDIGNPNDDFFGVDTAQNIVFGYNGDEEDEGFYESEIPAMAVQFLRGPDDAFGDPVGLQYVQPIPQGNIPLLGSYHLLSGKKMDGSPAEQGGLYYPGDPNDPTSGWSEVSEGNTPGQRRVITSYEPISLVPGAINELLVAYTFYQEPGNTPLENVQVMKQQASQIKALFDDCFEFSPGLACSPIISLVPDQEKSSFKIYPNPTHDFINLQLKENKLLTTRLMDLNGRLVHLKNWGVVEKQIQIPASHLSSGVYFLEMKMENGEVWTEKVIIMK